MREERPSWGREKLRVLLAREGITISVKSIDRVMARLKARGVLREPLRARFLRKVLSAFPFPIQAIQSDGGSEFLGEFAQTASELKLTHYFNRPNYPQGNGRIERSFRTDDNEFYHVHELPAELGGLEHALLAWNHVYETIRPHQALRYLTPDQFYQQWITANHQRKEAVSDMS